MFSIRWQRKARKQVAKITDKATRIDIEEAIDTLSDLPTAKNVKALTNHKCCYRLKVGYYRVLFDVENDVQIIDIQEVKKRDDNTY